MQRAIRASRRYLGIGVLALASCTSPAAIQAVPMAKNPDHAIVLIERPVLAGGPAGDVEYVVRTDGGATLAIVQPSTPGLQPGASATIIWGDRTTLAGR